MTVRNADVRCITEQAALSSTVKSPHLSMFGHVANMDGEADFERTPEFWKRPSGRPCSTWLKNITDDLSFDTGLLEARDTAQNRCSWRPLTSLHTHSGV